MKNLDKIEARKICERFLLWDPEFDRADKSPVNTLLDWIESCQRDFAPQIPDGLSNLSCPLCHAKRLARRLCSSDTWVNRQICLKRLLNWVIYFVRREVFEFGRGMHSSFDLSARQRMSLRDVEGRDRRATSTNAKGNEMKMIGSWYARNTMLYT